jgi:hypothetical protein
MNDFTEEELEIMKYWCRESHTIVDKIQSLIDNYCVPVCPDCGSAECFKNYRCGKNE